MIKTFPSRSRTSSVLSSCSSTVGHECGEHVNMVRWKTKIARRAIAVIMTHKLARLLCWRAIFSFTKHKGDGNHDRINWTSKVILTLIYFWSRCTCVISSDTKQTRQGYHRNIHSIYRYICVYCNGDNLYSFQFSTRRMRWSRDDSLLVATWKLTALLPQLATV